MKQLKMIGVLLIMGILLLGCAKEGTSLEDEKELSAAQIRVAAGVTEHKNGHMEFDKDSSAYDLNYIRELEVSDIGQTYEGSIHNITGKITNTSDIVIDEIVKMIIIAEEEHVEKIQYVPVTLSPGEEMYFDQIVGQDVPGVEILLQEI